MASQPDYSTLVRHIEEAGPQPLYWSEALKVLSHQLGDAAVGLILDDQDGSPRPIGSAVHFDSGKMLEWRRAFHDADPWTRVGCFPRPGEVIFCPMPPEDIKKTTYYQEWMKPQGFLANGIIASCLNQTSRACSQSLGFFSRSEGRELNERDRQLIVEVLPHIQKAAAVSRQVLGLNAQSLAFSESLSLVRVPILHLNADATISWANPEMAALLQRGNSIEQRGGRLAFPDRPSETQFNAILLELNPASRCGDQKEILVPHRNGGSPQRFTVCRSHARASNAGDQPRYLLFGSTRILTIEGDDAYFVRTYGLTESEARLTLELVAGATTQDASHALSLTPGTIREYLKRIFRKTHTRSQVELMRVLVRDLTSTPRAMKRASQP